MKTSICAVFVGCMLCFVGCGDGSKGLKLVPVAGVVKYKDAPVAYADLVFYPEKGPVAVAKTDSNGAFQVKTNGQSGGTVGKSKVTVTSRPAAAIPPSDRRAFENVNKPTLPEKYATEEETDLVIVITADGNRDLKLDLTD